MELPFEAIEFALGAALGGVSVPARRGSILIRLKSQSQFSGGILGRRRAGSIWDETFAND